MKMCNNKSVIENRALENNSSLSNTDPFVPSITTPIDFLCASINDNPTADLNTVDQIDSKPVNVKNIKLLKKSLRSLTTYSLEGSRALGYMRAIRVWFDCFLNNQ